MARFSSYPILVAFFFAIITIATKISATKYESLYQCERHIGSHCGKQVFDKLFHDNRSVIAEDCCYKLVQSGHYCHTRLVKHVFVTKPELKRANWTIVLAKSDEIFHKCDQDTKPADPAFLARCTEKIGPHCGEEVFNKLVHDKNITQHCCVKLVAMGQPCHVNMVKALIRTVSDVRNANATQVLEKSKKIFHHCLHVGQ